MATDNPRRERHLREAIEAEKAAFAERVQRLTKLGADPTSVTLDLLVTEMVMAKIERKTMMQLIERIARLGA